jgi:1-deoxy-D-xylulose-5-phosphate reductoisomerase
MSKSVTILGSTGSVGCSTLDLMAHHAEDFDVVVLTAHSNLDLLIQQSRQFNPKLVVIAEVRFENDLRQALAGTDIQVLAGETGLKEAAQYPSDFVMAAIVGAAGLVPTLEAVRRGATIGLANKECLVCAGELFMSEVKQAGTRLLPVDSEHNAIYQVFDFDKPESIEKITLTASGGPFRETSLEALKNVTPAQAIKHPNWDMGRKISVDSATLMNKGLEVIEAWYLFPINKDQIEVVIHPQSIIHSLVSYVDGSVLAQLGSPDMRTPISYALNWPDRMDSKVEKLNLASVGTLQFEAPDFIRFPALKLARQALQTGGTAPTILNAANEVAVEGFLAEKLAFLDIPSAVEEVLGKMDVIRPTCLGDVHEADQEARQIAIQLIADRGT